MFPLLLYPRVDLSMETGVPPSVSIHDIFFGRPHDRKCRDDTSRQMVRPRPQAVKVRLGSSTRPGQVYFLRKCLGRCLGQDTPLFRGALHTLWKEPKGDGATQ
jgi:hypothetical protein